MTHTLILLRHGNSEWNQKNLFTGWVDVGLTEQGRGEAARAGELIAAFDKQPDVLYTSLLKRAIHTANIALEVADLGCPLSVRGDSTNVTMARCKAKTKRRLLKSLAKRSS